MTQILIICDDWRVAVMRRAFGERPNVTVIGPRYALTGQRFDLILSMVLFNNEKIAEWLAETRTWLKPGGTVADVYG